MCLCEFFGEISVICRSVIVALTQMPCDLIYRAVKKKNEATIEAHAVVELTRFFL